MPSVEENIIRWQRDYPWPEDGAEWSEAWGGVESQWLSTVFPRIRHYLPADRVLEIAPGFGRWTGFLLGACKSYIGIDLSSRAIQNCRKRFASAGNATFEVNDGRSLAGVADHSVDFAFSFDSLVHADSDVIAGYLSELARVLHPEGTAFLHHSNLGACDFEVVQKHWRAESMSARLFRDSCQETGLHCSSQELVNWGQEHLIDCFSVVTPRSSAYRSPPVCVANYDFAAEIRSAERRERLYR